MRYITPVLLMALVQGCSSSVIADKRSPAVDATQRFTLPHQVVETSGLAKTGDTWWTINDSGDKPRLYAFSDKTGELIHKLRLRGVNNRDWEDLAQDQRYLYIADTGNNSGKRKDLSIHKVEHRALLEKKRVTPTTLQIRYADYDEQTRGGRKAHNVDCEAIVIVHGKLWLFTKNRGDRHSRLYQADINARDLQTLAPVGEYPVEGLITAADYNAQTGELALLGYGYGSKFGGAFIWRVPVINGLPDWEQARRVLINRPGQWEAIYWQGDNRVVVSAGGSMFGTQELADIEL